MPLILTVAELAAAIRVTTSAATPPSEPHLSILHRLLRVAENLIDGYAVGAIDELKSEAAILTIGYLYDAPPVQRNPANAFVNSGAKALLSGSHVPVTATVGGPVAVAVSLPDTTLNPSHPVHPGTHYRYMGWSDNGIISQVELDAAARFTSDVLTVPNRATAGYIFFGVEASPGFPDSALLDGNPTNQITNFLQQAGTLMRDTEFVVIGVSTAELSAAMSGRVWTLGYGP